MNNKKMIYAEDVRELRQEAKAWILREATQFIHRTHAGATKNPSITIGQILAHLDSLVAPRGYVHLKNEHALRYQVVRNAVENAAKEGAFEVGTTHNSKGRESKCFSPVGWKPTRFPRARRPSFDVEVEGPDAAKTAARLAEWLEENHITATAVYAEKIKDVA